MKRFPPPVYAKRLLWALLASLALHLLALFAPWIPLPTASPRFKPLEVKLRIQPAGPVNTAPPARRRPPPPRRRAT
ncbi:MAG TPA: hypothetical protein DEP05_00415, partial [Betaproteobacteria bacterium]|nr:hypothetical protein [Betaproteobacteria bacterium]